MSNEKKYYYPTRDLKDPRTVILEPISEEVYRAIAPEIWRARKRLQRAKRCFCPAYKIWVCDGDCGLCEYQAAGNQVSMQVLINDTPEHIVEEHTLEEQELFIDDSPSPEEVVMKQALRETLYRELMKLDPERRRVIRLFLKGKSEREIAKILGLSRSTYKRFWKKIKTDLRIKLEGNA